MLSGGLFREASEWSFAATAAEAYERASSLRAAMAGQTASVFGTSVSALALPTVAML
jgi:hypothetical protein